MADELTRRQLEILGFIADEILHGMPPTLREICDRFGFASVHGAHDHLLALEKKRMIERRRHSPRNIRITAMGRQRLSRRAA